jgi:uncharacterized membrane protein YoaK (UPF0700 family)
MGLDLAQFGCYSPASFLRALVNPIVACSLTYWAGFQAGLPGFVFVVDRFGAYIMRRFVLPNVIELSILATLAVLAATIVAALTQPQVAIVVVGFPIVLLAMLMGARRTGQLDSASRTLATAAPKAEQSA